MAPPKKRKSSRQITPKATATKRIRTGRNLRSTTLANSITGQESVDDLRESDSVVFVGFLHLPETPVILVDLVNDGNEANAESTEVLVKANPSPLEKSEQVPKVEDEEADGSTTVQFDEIPRASGDQVSNDETEELVAQHNPEWTSREGYPSSTTALSKSSISADDFKHGEEVGSSEKLQFNDLPGTSTAQLGIDVTEEPLAEPNLEGASRETTFPSISSISAAQQDEPEHGEEVSSAQRSFHYYRISHSLSNTSASHQGSSKHDEVELESDEAPMKSDEGVGSPATLSESGGNSKWDMDCEEPDAGYSAYWKKGTTQPEEVNASKSESRSSSLVTEYISCDEETLCQGFSD